MCMMLEQYFTNTLLVVGMLLLLFAQFCRSAHCSNYEDENVITCISLNATQDVWIEGTSNRNYEDSLSVGVHPLFPIRRSLVQFEDIPSNCQCVRWAVLHVHFRYAHKASFLSYERVPHIPRRVKVNQVNKPWSESEATFVNRLTGIPWTAPYLAMNGTDAAATSQGDGYIVWPSQTQAYISFNVTDAALRWKCGEPNYGLLLWATNEHEPGRDVRFYSREYATKEPYMEVYCGSGNTCFTCSTLNPGMPTTSAAGTAPRDTYNATRYIERGQRYIERGQRYIERGQRYIERGQRYIQRSQSCEQPADTMI